MLNASESEINTCLKEFKSYINRRNSEHWMLYFDLQLAVLQQSRASTGAINSNIEVSLKKLEELELKEHIRTAYIIKVARILTSCSGNPEHCIRMLTYKTKYLSKFSFCEKYSIYKDLYYLFTNLCGPILVCVPDLIEETERYFKHDATNEINVYLTKLPEEAIFDHIYYTQELAWLRRITDQNHDFALIKADLTSAIHLCEENSLISQAMTIETFPLILGLLMTPKFMPEFGIKRCTMSDSAKTYVHYWLVNPSLGIEIDPLYKNFTNDENTDRIFFILNGHPLQTKESITAKSMTSVKIEIKPSQLITLDKTFIAMYSEILELLQKELNKNS